MPLTSRLTARSRNRVLAIVALTAITFGSGAVILTHAADAQAPALPANGVWLDTLDLSKMKVGFGKPQAKLSIDKNALTMGGQKFERGIGTHAISQIAIDLGGRARRFSAMVGVDDEVAKKGSVLFEVYLDGKLVRQSGLIRGGDRSEKLSVDLTGAQRMILRVDDNQDGNNSDHANWGDAFIVMLPGALPPVAVETPLLMTALDSAPPMPIARASVAQPQPRIRDSRRARDRRYAGASVPVPNSRYRRSAADLCGPGSARRFDARCPNRHHQRRTATGGHDRCQVERERAARQGCAQSDDYRRQI